MKRRFATAAGLIFALAALAGCSTPGDGMANAPRTDQEKAFRGDPSKAPDSVRNMMQNPPTNSRPPQPNRPANP